MSTIEVKVPNIGDFDEVEVIEVLITSGDTVRMEDSLITLESEKASMEIPSSAAGVVKEVLVKVGDKIAENDVICLLDTGAESVETSPAPMSAWSKDSAPVAEKGHESIAQAAAFDGELDISTEVVVLGAGPGGYTAAFRAADLGKKVVLIEKDPYLGGVCLNVGCIPSKALLHVAEVLTESQEFSKLGVAFNTPTIDTHKLREHKNKVVGKLTGGLKQLAKQRKVQVVEGYGKFTSTHTIAVESTDGTGKIIGFDHCIIAAGSTVARLPFVPWDDPRVWDSTDALELHTIPKRLLVVGGGIIGLEMATVYSALGSAITVVELSEGLIPGVDRDLIRPFERVLKKRYENIFLNTKVTAITPADGGVVCQFEGAKAPAEDTFDAVLVAIGRTPNGRLIDAEHAGVNVDERGFIAVDKQQRTNVDHIFAIGDVVGQPMLAHKATHEAKVAAEVIAGMKRYFDARTIPSVAYTNPEVAWCGQTEAQLIEQGVEYEKGAFPWAASGRALSVGADTGVTKVLYDKHTHRMLGCGIVGKNAGELIAEATLAVEMGADVDDVGLTIHPHPTLSETINFATEIVDGRCTDIYAPKKS